ncbi:ty3-gypsy retrotransposon protein [Cucumis melo var. makuwa]|uniref:Ty3-gypsy retrotransposon protein n=1 Tax=Cucumis melo var. makuwa TaxID=1194695 RepID=A0A5D3DDR5_CUCMM|nr:ty3-gypsy retrotransposon protein [Cucumis melo var. makuwa]
MKAPAQPSSSPSSSAPQRQRTTVRSRPIFDPPLCLTQPVDYRPSLPSISSSSSVQSPPPPTSFSSVHHPTQPRRIDVSCSLSPSRFKYKYWNKTWNYLSFLEGVRELTLEFLGFTAGLIGDSSPLLGWIRLDADLNEILATSQVRVWRGARRMREGHMDASGFLYAAADVFCYFSFVRSRHG